MARLPNDPALLGGKTGYRLSPRPFCGGDPVIETEPDWVSIFCDECGATIGNDPPIERALLMWERRTDRHWQSAN